MKNKMKSAFMVALMGTGLFFTSCDNNDSIAPDETYTYDKELKMAEGDSDKTIIINATKVTETEMKVLVSLTSTSDEMDRIYITENIAGKGAEAFKFTSAVDYKADGSLDLKSTKEYAFQLAIPKLSMSAGTVEYKLWATNGKGDFRDNTVKKIVGIGTIIINYGGANADSEVSHFEAKILAAPLADGTSETFISTIDGQLYKINGAAEYSAFWDFGYFYGASLHASLVSPNNYPTDVIDIRAKAGLDANATLNKCFFKKSTKTSTDFEDVEISKDLDFITPASVERITGLAANDIIEFVDNYGKKGLIKVLEVKGTFGTSDYIKIEVKVQP